MIYRHMVTMDAAQWDKVKDVSKQLGLDRSETIERIVSDYDGKNLADAIRTREDVIERLRAQIAYLKSFRPTVPEPEEVC